MSECKVPRLHGKTIKCQGNVCKTWPQGKVTGYVSIRSQRQWTAWKAIFVPSMLTTYHVSICQCLGASRCGYSQQGHHLQETGKLEPGAKATPKAREVVCLKDATQENAGPSRQDTNPAHNHPKEVEQAEQHFQAMSLCIRLIRLLCKMHSVSVLPGCSCCCERR